MRTAASADPVPQSAVTDSVHGSRTGKSDQLDLSQRVVDEDEAREIGELIAFLNKGPELKTATAAEIGDSSILFYALRCHDESGDSISFVKRSTSIRPARQRIVGALGDTLIPIKRPVLAFSRDFDLVITSSDIAILNANTFLTLFTDLEMLKRAVPEMADTVLSATSMSVDGDSVVRLKKLCEQKASLAKRLRRLQRLPYLPQITASTLAKCLSDLPGLPDGIEVKNGQVRLEESGIPIFLDILEQIVYKGAFDGSLYRADRHRSL